MQLPLLSLLPDTLRFHLGKLYEGLYWNDPDADLHLSEVSCAYLAVTTAIESPDHPPSMLPAATDILHRIRYILDRLRQWIDTGTLFQNDDAEVFLDALSAHWATLAGMLREVDEDDGRIMEAT